jgi:hypothetical protein
MKQLCQIIQINGQQQDDAMTITFGDLFEVCHIYLKRSYFYDYILLRFIPIYQIN